ncbi:MAG: 16S rRNA (cytosine(967)-C(5))-methyltransferase RsmB [Gammaproteobacteria bacterium]|nr:16S rRNA (cytosine(967)-C(5))-methyltransferase RsmB [Gammaproteobacteria bacterium]MCY4218854.1 16S rRNA (cytosine(967)-C(5))-methyltransferase RsmB [Gammaproteobacteria bacterium]MCY4274474.1 16S rRNA (cytosine(967)-C(5))-methyltransferase RsmB [Gammaproteobacteria bacterium]
MMSKPFNTTTKDLKYHTSDLLASAAKTILRVIDHGESLDRLLDQFRESGQSGVSVFQEIAYGTCRYFPHIDYFLGVLMKRPIREKDRILHFLLAVGIYQIEHMHTPIYAVLNETVEATSQLDRSWARKLINGVLRNHLRNRNKYDLSNMPEHQANAFPKAIFDRIKADWSEHYLEIVNASNTRPPLTLRVNLNKITRNKAIQIMQENAMVCEATQDSPAGLILSSPVPVSQIPEFSKGMVSVQDESAQLAALELDIDKNLNILDACAAPGGKTTHLIELFRENCTITAVDLDSRCILIQQNLTRIGQQAKIVAGDLLQPDIWWDGNLYDRILLDAPCSGSGVIRRHPDIKYRRNLEELNKLHSLQLSMLKSVWPLLRPGGILLYVTCSVFHRENDDVIADFFSLTKNYELQAINNISGISTRFGVQRLPSKKHGDGFYYCKIRKSLITDSE